MVIGFGQGSGGGGFRFLWRLSRGIYRWFLVFCETGLEPRLRLLRIQTLNPKFCLMSPAHVGWFVGFRVCKVEVRVESRKFMVCKATS